MAISVVSSVSFGSAYSSYSIQTDSEYEEICKKLIAMGQTPTGDKSIDKAKLEELQKAQSAQTDKTTQTTQTQQSSGASKTSDKNSVYLTKLNKIANELGITRTDDLESDVKKIMNMLADKITDRSISSSEYSKYTGYVNDLDEIIIGMGLNVSRRNLDELMVGSTYMGDYNRQMLNL